MANGDQRSSETLCNSEQLRGQRLPTARVRRRRRRRPAAYPCDASVDAHRASLVVGLASVAPWIQKLYLAVLDQAIADLHDQRAKVRHAAKAWWESNDERWPLSMVNVCMALSLEADFLRRGERQRH